MPNLRASEACTLLRASLRGQFGQALSGHGQAGVSPKRVELVGWGHAGRRLARLAGSVRGEVAHVLDQFQGLFEIRCCLVAGCSSATGEQWIPQC